MHQRKATAARDDVDAQASLLYSQRLERCRMDAATLGRRDDRLAIARFACAAACAGGLAIGWMGRPIGFVMSIWSIPVFILLSVYQARVGLSLDRAKRLEQYYEAGLRRMNGEWQGRGVDGVRFVDPEHPYTGDLDIFGKGSLFELLCTARTRAGEEQLAGMLSTAADADTARRRQAATRELMPRNDLREEMALLGRDVRSRIDPNRLIAWSK